MAKKENPAPVQESPQPAVPVKAFYWVPDYGVSVEATSTSEAVKLAEKQANG